MKVHVWKRWTDDGLQMMCGAQFKDTPDVSDHTATMHPSALVLLCDATCLHCLKAVHSAALGKVNHYAPIAATATARLDSLRRKSS